MDTISVMLIDDNPVFLRATAQFLEAHDDVAVVGTADRGDKALAQIRDLQPRIVLVDLAMPDLSGLATIPRLRHLMPQMGIIALTVMDNEGFRQAALTAGADVFIPKATMRTDLLPAIRSLAQAERTRATEQADCRPPDDGPPTSRRILVMEDESSLRRLFSKVLRAAGYEVHSAATVQETRDLLSDTRFDVLLCDIHMGNDRGTDLLDEYADELAISGAQVIMVSGQPHYRHMCTEMGADFFLEKPVAVGSLVALVDRLTARQRP